MQSVIINLSLSAYTETHIKHKLTLKLRVQPETWLWNRNSPTKSHIVAAGWQLGNLVFINQPAGNQLNAVTYCKRTHRRWVALIGTVTQNDCNNVYKLQIFANIHQSAWEWLQPVQAGPRLFGDRLPSSWWACNLKGLCRGLCCYQAVCNHY